MSEFKNVNFAPWIGKNYEKGIDERKILILGESHHWGEDVNDGVNEELRNGKYLKFTQQVVESYVDYQKGNKEHQSWMNTFTKFIKEFYNWEDSKINLIIMFSIPLVIQEYRLHKSSLTKVKKLFMKF